MCARFLSALQSDLRRVSLALLPVTLLSLAPVMTANSQEPKPSLLQLLTQAEKSLTVLEARLQERKAQIESLQKELTISASLIAQARELRDKSQAEFTETSTRLMALEVRLEKLSKDFEKYKEASNRKIAGLEMQVGIYRGATVTLGIGCVAGGVYVVGDRMGWW